MRQRGTGAAQRIAIVDDSPKEQYLYPEFVLARQVLAARGVDAIIADASHLRYEGGQLSIEGKPVDLVYNRVTDFAFEWPVMPYPNFIRRYPIVRQPIVNTSFFRTSNHPYLTGYTLRLAFWLHLCCT